MRRIPRPTGKGSCPVQAVFFHRMCAFWHWLPNSANRQIHIWLPAPDAAGTADSAVSLPAQLNNTGGMPFSGIRKAKYVNAARHRVINRRAILPRKETLCLGRNRMMLSTRDITQRATSRIKLTQRIIRFPLPKVPRTRNAATKIP